MRALAVSASSTILGHGGHSNGGVVVLHCAFHEHFPVD